MWTLLLSSLISMAAAQDCDVTTLKKQTQAAAPTQVAAPFAALAACDAGAAEKLAPAVFESMVTGSDAPKAVVAGIQIGAHAEVLGWLDRQEPDVRSRAVSKLGTKCDKTPAVGDFFVFVKSTKGKDFWVERWHRGLGECRVPAVRDLLSAAVDDAEVGRKSRANTQFYSLLEVYARNLGADAVPKLEEFLGSARDEKEAVAIVSVLPDAANVGGAGGPDGKATKAILEALDRLAPNLAPKAIDTARTSLASLGKEDVSGQYARYRWPEAFQGDQYSYGLSVIEDITCKNGSRRAVLHTGIVTEAGAMWPDALDALVQADVSKRWDINAARKCKGTAEVRINLTPLPLGVEEPKADWNRRILEKFRDTSEGAKTWIVAEDGFGY